MDLNEDIKPLLETTLDHALHYLETLDDSKVSATLTLDAIRKKLNKPLQNTGMNPEKIINELVDDTRGALLGNAGGRFFAWVIGGSLPASLAADWLVSTWDQNPVLYACSPAISVIEEITGKWLKELLGLSESVSHAFVTGCQMAHVTCLAAARNYILEKENWDVEKKGLSGSPKIRIIGSENMHTTVDRASRIIGIGTDNIIKISEDNIGGLSLDRLEDALKVSPDSPTIVLLQAGDLNTGSFDNFEKLIPIAHQYNAWVHIDGAFGLWANASPDYRHYLKGIENADSWATDGHKWLNVPYDSGFAFVAHPPSQIKAMSSRASYMVLVDGARDEVDWNPEFSRRARSVAAYAAIRQLGKNGVADLVNKCCKHAHSIVTGIGKFEGAEMLWEPIINQGLVRFLSPDEKASQADHDEQTDKVIEEILKDGRAFFGGTTWRDKRCMRVSVSNWRTNDKDVGIAIDSVKSAIEKCRSISP